MHVQLLPLSSAPMTLSAPSKWLAEELSLLLSSPHVNAAATDPPADIFTTRFNHVFMRHARGLVGGKEVDRDELMRTFLELQKRWNPSDCTYLDCELHHRIEGFHPEMGVKMQFTPQQATRPLTITWEACVSKQRNGQPRIKTLMLEGDLDLIRD